MRGKRDDWRTAPGSARGPRAGDRVLAIANFVYSSPFYATCKIQRKNCFGATPKPARETRALPNQYLSTHDAMIGEGIQSTNQRRHSYVGDRIEVGFFTDPTVCIGCKACEVACKEWNEVPDDGFTWSGNSYDNTGRLGASTWRHVLFLEQDRRKGQQVVGSLGNGEDPFRWVFLSDV